MAMAHVENRIHLGNLFVRLQHQPWSPGSEKWPKCRITKAKVTFPSDFRGRAMEESLAPWLRLRIEALKGWRPPGTFMEAAALVNTGYRAGTPHLALPATVAERLGLWPDPPAGTVIVPTEAFGGVPSKVFGVTDALRVRVLASDRESATVACACLVVPGETEILMSSALTSALGIVILDAVRGLWCFRDELGKIERPSEPPQAW